MFPFPAPPYFLSALFSNDSARVGKASGGLFLIRGKGREHLARTGQLVTLSKERSMAEPTIATSTYVVKPKMKQSISSSRQYG
jgi:hypothetical protein